jgi:hypothetical protein
MLLFKIFTSIILVILGVFFLIKTEPIVRTVGHNSLTEKYLGQGGTYTFWKILGAIFIILGVLLIFGKLNWLIEPLF